MRAKMVKETSSDLKRAISLIEKSNEYKLLRRVPEITKSAVEGQRSDKYALIVDTETTGLDVTVDDVIELGYVLLRYNSNGEATIVESGGGLQYTDKVIPEAVVKLTGITASLLEGQSIDKDEVRRVLSISNIIIAHNAAFDRPMCERFMPEFSDKPWACSLNEVPWSDFGFENKKLKYLLIDSGYFYDAHRAVDDCSALSLLLMQQAQGNGTFLKILLDNARNNSFLINVKTPYSLRTKMRDAGYRWRPNKGFDGGFWEKEVLQDDLPHEEGFLEALKLKDYHVEKKTSFDRYKYRMM